LAWVGDVGFLIIRSAVLAVPARREHEFEADTISAVGIKVGLVGKEVTVERALGCLLVVEAVESKSGLAEEGLLSELAGPEGLFNIRDRVGKVSLVGVASNHLKTLRESSDRLAASVRVEKVVSD